MIKPIRVLFLFLLSGFVIFLYLGLPHIFASVLKNVFQQGTGCAVSVSDPEIDYIHGIASIHAVSVVCEHEKNGEGFYAKEITAGITLSKLFQKRAIVTPLKIIGARAISLSWDSAFIRTLEFVLSKPKVRRTTWKAWVPDVEIVTTPGEKNVFEFGTKDASVVADSVYFTAIDPVDHPDTAVILEASAKNARLKTLSTETIELGEVELLAQSKDGKILFLKNSLSSPEQGITHYIDGHILSKANIFNLDVHTQFLAAEPKALRLYEKEYVYQGNAAVETHIRGPFVQPEIDVAIQTSKLSSYGIKDEAGRFSESACMPLEIDARARFAPEQISIDTLNIGHVLKSANVTYSFSQGHYVSHKDAIMINLDGLNKMICNKQTAEKGLDKNMFVPVTVSLGIDAHGNLNGKLLSQNLKLEQMPYLSEILKKGSHPSTLSISAHGTLEAPHIEGTVSVKSSGLERTFPSELSFLYTLKGFEYKGNIFSEENTISGTIDNVLAGKQSQHIEANFKKFPLAFFIASEINSALYSQIEAEFKSDQSSFSDLSGTIKLMEVDLSPQYQRFRPPTPILIKANKGSYEISSQPFDFQGLKVDLQGAVSKEEKVQLVTHVSGDLPQVLAKLVGAESLTGNLQADIKIDGTLDAPKLYGRIIVDDGTTSFKIGDRISSIDKITSLITFDDTIIEIRKLEGSFGEGDIRVLGKIDNFLNPTARTGQIGVFGNNLLLEPVAGLSMYADVNLAMLYHAQGLPVIRGDIVLNEATYQRNFSIQAVVESIRSFILGSRSRIIDAGNDQAVPILLDIHARSSQGLLVDTTVLQAELDGDLKIIGSTVEPQVAGEVHIIEGSFKINQTNFSIMSGSMKFDGSSHINPLVQLSSEGDLRKRSGETEKIFLNISGPLNATKVSFASDGASRPNDIVRQLGLGSVGSQLALVDSNRKNVGFREVLSPSSDLTLSERFAGLTGFDQVRIENAISVRTGDFVPQVLASRPFPYELRGTIWTELAGDRASGARIERRLQDNYSVFVGWRNQSVIDASASTSGSNMSIGFRFRETFKGFSFFDQRVKVLE